MITKVFVVFVMLAYVSTCMAQFGAPGASVGSFPLIPSRTVIPTVGLTYRHLELEDPLLVKPILHTRTLPTYSPSYYPWSRYYL